jgi:hypothetical protein
MDRRGEVFAARFPSLAVGSRHSFRLQDTT